MRNIRKLPGYLCNKTDVYQMSDIFQSSILLFVLFNLFSVIIYLMDMAEKLNKKQFFRILIYAGIIAGAVYSCFAVLGDAVFGQVMQAEFVSFQIFGGVIFLLIGLRFFPRGPSSIKFIKNDSG